MQNTIFITGASSGLGKATALLFHQKGWNVIATMRAPEKETELTQLKGITILPLDVTKPSQIEATVAKALDISEVDVVFNNAGYGLMGTLEALSDEQIVTQLNTNLIGVIRVTKAFIPHFRQRKQGLFLSTTSIGGTITFPLHSIYHASKFALEGWSSSMSYELSLHNIKIKTIAPGAIATDFIGRSLDKATMPAYKTLEDQLFNTTAEMMNYASSPEQIASIVYQAVNDEKDLIKYAAGEDAKTILARHAEIGSEKHRQEIKTNFNL